MAVLLATSGWGAELAPAKVQEIVERSVKNTDAGWAVAPHYDFTERDAITKDGTRTLKTYEVLMIEGSPYNKLLAVNGEPLSAAEAAHEERKLRQETERRRNETPSARQERIAEYKKERRQDLALMTEMTRAFDFKPLGEETVNGRRCFVLAATPRPGYQPSSRETSVLKGMRGKMWIDQEQYQWVRVHAEVFRPVAFGLVIASVRPGTEFTLEQRPIGGNIWLPSHFSTHVNARVLLWSRNSVDDETYWNYHPASAAVR